MTPKKLDHFLKIVQAGSLSRAADDLQIAHSALSREVKELEAEIGVKLLQRNARGVEATPAGEALRRQAEIILGLLGKVRDEVNNAADKPSGSVAFGMTATMCGILLAPLVKNYIELYPDVKLRIREGTSFRLRSALLAREIDVAVLNAPIAEPQLIFRPFFIEPFVLVGPANSNLHKRSKISMQEVSRLKLILPVAHNTTRMLIDTAFEKQGLVPHNLLETDDAAPMIQLVAAELGYAMMPASSVSAPTHGAAKTVHVPIEGLTLTRGISAPAGVSMSLATQKMCQLICTQTKALLAAKKLRGEYIGP